MVKFTTEDSQIIGNNRNYLDENKMINLIYDELILIVSDRQQNSFQLTCVYNHEIQPKNSNEVKEYSLDRISKFHLEEVFIPHLTPSHPTLKDGAFRGKVATGNDSGELAYEYGFYAAAFFML